MLNPETDCKMTKYQEVRIFFNHLKFVRRYSSHTTTAYKADLAQFQKFFKRNLLSATRKDIRDFLVSLIVKEFSLRTVNRKLEVLKSFYRYHWKHSNIETSPCWNIRQFRFVRPKGRFIPVDDVIQTLDNIDPYGNRKKLRDRLILELLYCTGCRACEIINLKKKDIDYSRIAIKVTGKGNRERLVTINPKLIELIKLYLVKWRHKNRSQFLLNNDKGKRIYSMFLWRVVRKYFSPEKLKINTSAHVLRHSIATHLYHNRAPLHDIKNFLGHRSLKTTAIYLHFGIDHLKEVYAKAHPKERLLS
jgi:integrase/recombinase XerC